MSIPAAALPRFPLKSVWVPAVFLAFIGACVVTLSGDWSGLFSRSAVASMLAFFGSFFPPAGGTAFLQRVVAATLQTLAISLIGTLLAALGGLALSLPASGRLGRIARACARWIANVLRAVPELVWAAMIVVAAGLGPLAGTLALAIHTTGVLGRLFAESLENIDPEPCEALRRNGVSSLPAFWYATFPQVLPQLVSYTLYRWENNIRAAAVLGVVGAGGLGQMLYVHLSLFQVHQAATVLIAMVLLVALVDAASNAARARLIR
jgi:phosphonate transport system permease protein